jgi:hypothetical protein
MLRAFCSIASAVWLHDCFAMLAATFLQAAVSTTALALPSLRTLLRNRN